MGDFLRILVQVDIRKPLRHCVHLGDSAGKEASSRPLRYERLPEFCYFCGLVSHSLSSCTAKPADLDARKLQYGSWLRVPPSVNRDARPPASQDERPVANQDARPAATEATTDLPTAQATAKVSQETSSDSPSATVSVTVHADVPHVSTSPEIVAGVQQPLPPPIFASSNVNAGTEPNEDVVLPSSQAAKEPGLSLSISAIEVKHSEGSKDAGSGLPLSIPAAVCNLVRAKRSLQGKYETIVTAKGGARDYFHFDSCWSKEEACIERVCSSWLHSSGSTVSKLLAIGDSLRSWQADRRASSTKRMSDLQGFLNSCMQGSITDEAKMAFLDAKREHKSLLDKDEAYWAQRARVTWLTQGDRNSAYFHARASGRRKKNRIRRLFDESGIWTDK
ncbi:hypothetical protein V6N13_051446 [Hibiscus sabdariffa]